MKSYYYLLLAVCLTSNAANPLKNILNKVKNKITGGPQSEEQARKNVKEKRRELRELKNNHASKKEIEKARESYRTAFKQLRDIKRKNAKKAYSKNTKAKKTSFKNTKPIFGNKKELTDVENAIASTNTNQESNENENKQTLSRNPGTTKGAKPRIARKTKGAPIKITKRTAKTNITTASAQVAK